MGKAMVFLAGLALLSAWALHATPSNATGGESESQSLEVMTISLSGRVLDAVTGAPVAGASVSILDATVTTDQEGRYVFPAVAGSRDAMLNFRVMAEDGRVLGCAFIAVPVSLQPVSARLGDKFAVAVAKTDADVTDFNLSVAEARGAAVDAVCEVCHKPNPCLAVAKEGQGWSDVTHLGGVAVTEQEFEETKVRVLSTGVREEDYPNLRYQDAHPQKVSLASAVENKPTGFKQPDLLALAEGSVTTCDTCHTRHEPTENSLFLRLDIARQTLLCRQCHI